MPTALLEVERYSGSEAKIKLPTAEAGAISLPVFIIILLAAIMADLFDLVEAVPVIGIVLAVIGGFIFDTILWIIYWSIGARGLRNGIFFGLDIIAKEIPVVNLLPLNTLTAISVYLMNQAWFQKLFSKVTAIAVGRMVRRLPKLKSIAPISKEPLREAA